jgi:hypothetical protein
MTDARETVQTVGETLVAFMKSGPTSPDHAQETRTTISGLVRSIAASADEATASYEQVCREFLDKVIRVKGMPTRVISGDRDSRPDIVSSSGKNVAQNFDALLPSIRKRFEWCASNYKSEATAYLNEQLSQCDAMVQQFLERVPMGGTKDKDTRRRITEIKKELRPLAKWDQLFYVHKAMSFPAEVEFLISLEGNPIAAIWHYNPIDEQTDYLKTYDHKHRDGLVYAVRGNWAAAKGLMNAGPNGYLDEISRPSQETGCMCHLQWLYSVSRLPKNMMTEKGLSELRRVQAAVQTKSGTEKPRIAAEPEIRPSGLTTQLMRWFGFRGS